MGGVTTVINGWYFQVATLIYLIFWGTYSIKIKEHYKTILLGLGVVLYIGISILIGAEWHLYQTAFLFLVGVVASKYKGVLTRFNSCKLILLMGLFLFVGLFLLRYSLCLTALSNAIITTIMVIMLIVSLIGIGLLRYINNKVFCFLGEISLELYGVHGAFITIFKSGLLYIANDYLFLAAVFLFSLASAWMLHKVFSFIDLKIRKCN